MAPARIQIQKTIVLLIAAVLLTVTTGFCGGAPLKALRVKLGRAPFALIVAGICALFLGLGWVAGAYSFLTLAVFMALFVEFDERGEEIFYSGLFATLITSSLVGVGFVAWMGQVGTGWYGDLTGVAQGIIDQYVSLSAASEVTITARDFVVQSPSAVVIILLLALMLAMVFENGIALWLGLPITKRSELRNFHLPESFVWILIASLGGAYFKHGVPWVEAIAVNVFHISLLLYFFQGLAVVSHFFKTFRVGRLWRTVWLTILVLQLFMFVSLLGLIDYWVDFRGWFMKKAAQLDKNV